MASEGRRKNTSGEADESVLRQSGEPMEKIQKLSDGCGDESATNGGTSNEILAQLAAKNDEVQALKLQINDLKSSLVKKQAEFDEYKRNKALSELDELGFAVIPNVLTIAECDQYIAEYMQWLKQFGDVDWPFVTESHIQSYRIGHFPNSWAIRLKMKPTFANIWGTEKLLTSLDAVAICQPPEEGSGNQLFSKPGENWFHIQQRSSRTGVHAYQGAVYLEETSETDYCFRLLAKSHKYHTEFFDNHYEAAKSTQDNDFYKLNPKDEVWFKEKGCEEKLVPVPKGGIVLYDARVVCDNCRPDLSRPNKDRWRFVTFVCMTPAIWASPEDLEKKREIYKKLLMTDHWPSQSIKADPEHMPLTCDGRKVTTVDVLPDIAQTREARLLVGADEYDFKDGAPNGPEWMPEWTEESVDSKLRM